MGQCSGSVSTAVQSWNAVGVIPCPQRASGECWRSDRSNRGIQTAADEWNYRHIAAYPLMVEPFVSISHYKSILASFCSLFLLPHHHHRCIKSSICLRNPNISNGVSPGLEPQREECHCDSSCLSLVRASFLATAIDWYWSRPSACCCKLIYPTGFFCWHFHCRISSLLSQSLKCNWM